MMNTSVMKKPFCILTHSLPKEWLESLEGRVDLLIGPTEPPGLAPQLMDRLYEADGLLTILIDRVDDELLAKAPRLKVVSNMAVGVDNIDLAACKKRGILVGNTPDVLTEGTADLTMAILLSAARKLPQASQDAREGLWKTWSPTGWLGADLTGATLGIIGLGKIGKAVAKRAKGFGMRLVYTDSIRQLDQESLLNITYLSMDELLANSDFVTIHCPLLPETRGLLNESAMRKMKRTAILINAARGPIVDTPALLRALREGWITAAALDVTDPEPLPASHPLYSLTNCLIVPHIGSATYGTRQKMCELACANLLAGVEGRSLVHQIK